MTVSHKQLNEIFLLLDKNALLSNVFFESWLVWPIVKGRMWHFILRQNFDEGSNRKNIGVRLLNVMKGLGEALACIFFRGRCGVAYCYSPRYMHNEKNQIIHPILGQLLDDQRRDSFKIIYHWGGAKSDSKLKNNTLHESYIGNLLVAIALLLSRRQKFHSMAQQICEEIKMVFPDLPLPSAIRECRLGLSIFWVKYHFYRLLLTVKKNRPEKLYIQDPDAKPAEVAAFKSMGACIIEVQHGLFGPKEVDYSWTAEYKQLKKYMCVPDMVYVYGSFWKDLLLLNNFWTDEEIKIVGYPAIHQYQKRVDEETLQPKPPFTILFPAQYYISSASIHFWQSLLAMQKKGQENVFTLLIKVHPAELASYRHYLALEQQFPEVCEILSQDTNAFSAILRADLIVGYASMMLLEGLGLRKIVVGLQGGAVPEGICKTFDLQALGSAIPEFHCPKEFYAFLIKLSKDEQYYYELQQKIVSLKGLYNDVLLADLVETH